MVLERLKAAGEHPANQDPLRQRGIEKAREALKKYDVIDPGSAESILALSLEQRWKVQAYRLIRLGVPQTFNPQYYYEHMQYCESLPSFFPHPEEYKGRFDIPLIVETRLPIRDMIQSLNLKATFHPYDEIDNATTVPVPPEPYTIWLSIGRQYENYTAEEAIKQFSTDEQECTLIEALNFFLQYDEVFSRPYAVRIPGTILADQDYDYGEIQRIPVLSTFDDSIELFGRSINDTFYKGEGFGILSRGVKINTRSGPAMVPDI